MARNQFAQLSGFNAVRGSMGIVLDNWSTNAQYYAGATAGHSRPVEFGTWKMSAQPYFRPAVDTAVARSAYTARQANSAEHLLELLSIDIRDLSSSNAPYDTGELRNSHVSGKR